MIGCCGSIGADMRRHAGRLLSCRPSIKSWSGSDIGMELPLIIEVGERNGRFFYCGSPVLGSQLLELGCSMPT